MSAKRGRACDDSGGHSLAQRRIRYDDDDYDDIDIGHPHRQDEHPTSAGMYGFIFSLVSAGLLVVVVILWIFMQQEEPGRQNLERTRWMMYWFLLMDVLSFFAALTATVMGGRGLAASNSLYRGYSLTALIVGIIEMLFTLVFGFFMTCAVLVVELMRNAGG
ncbi:MAG: hypothetical protein EXR98_00515 [Gemmataceae bacterium]|nr:hypothetical protein [Gemmataceae bacterium]